MRSDFPKQYLTSLFFVSLEMSLFPSIWATAVSILYGEYYCSLYVFLPDGVRARF